MSLRAREILLAAALLAVGNAGCGQEGVAAPDGDADGDDDVDIEADVEADVEPEPVCDVLTGEGCGEGETCQTVVRDGALLGVGCVPAVDVATAEPGGPCQFESVDGLRVTHDCPSGHACVVVSSEGPPRCLKLCSVDDHSLCTGAYAGVDGVDRDGICMFGLGSAPGLEDVQLCALVHDCDPRCGGCPSRHDVCLPAIDSLRAGWICFAYIPAETGDGRTGDPCVYRNSCRAGYGCYFREAGTGAGECRPACDLRASGDAGPDPECPFTLCGAHEGLEAEGSCHEVPELRLVAPLPGLGLCLAE